MTESYDGHELEALAQAPNYYRWIVDHFRPWLNGTVLEVGAGVGTFAERVRTETRPERLVLVEPARNLHAPLRARFEGRGDVEVFPGTLEQLPPSPVDAAVMVNVLEHIEDDRATLRDLHRRLTPGGALLLFVPALPWLYGSLDEAFDHYRRYSRPELRTKIESAGFALERLLFMNLPGILNWLVAGRVLRIRTIRPGAMRTYDRLVVPAARAIESVVTPPLGQNLLAVAIKPRGTDE